MDALTKWSATVATRRKLRLSFKQIAVLGLACVAILAASGYGYYWWTFGRFFETTDDAYVGGNVTPIAPHIAGFVGQILVTDNQRVRAGQPLIRLDDRDVRAAFAHAQAVLQQHSAMLASLRAKYAFQQPIIAQAGADLDAKSAQAAFAQENAARYQLLVRTDSGTLQDAQRTTALDREANAAVAAAKAGLSAAKLQQDVLRADIAQAAAALAQAKADLETARLNLGYAEIRSPIDGYVGNRAAQVGAYVSAGTYLMSIVPAHGLWVDANFKEDQLARMQPGQKATIVADARPGEVFHGHVVSLAPATGAIFSIIPPENATGNFTKIVQRVPVRIALDDGDASLGKIRPGLSIEATVDTRKRLNSHHD